ncbi:cAMP-dependent protein kinase catalytic subunit PRKX-like isoform X1 [Varroa jacobsoni]|uniref:cAMP-dependent protein kinase catalytic subunit PRKX-like isoform X1 n=1 Tax=Varroa jacobsoni TaxID=62625 RepID=UPI000BF25B79|nr:cAMP-dependent protein kinase catalytic subunit PRKX-like isoform X1 [Varroa jacobsoni]
MACCRAVPTAKNCHFPAEKREMMARRTAYSNSPSCSCSSSSSSSGDNDGARGGSQDVTFTLAVCQNSTSPIGQDGNQMQIPPLNDGVSYSFRFSDLNVIKTIGTGTFGRVCLCRADDNYYALKIMRIDDVIRLKQVDHVRNEKAILQQIEHPFIIKLLWTHHSQQALYMLLEFVAGGELFTYLRNAGKFSNSAAVFYASEIVLALEYLHSKNIVYRDLKPENLLLDKSGHLKVTDFGFAKQLSDRTWTLCGTPEYLAPEIIQSKGHNKAVDWWALGILIFEMLCGHPPFYDDNPFGIYEKILAGRIEWPKLLDPVAKDLIKKLLVNERSKRLGSMKSGAGDVKNHRWFSNVNWAYLYMKRVRPPFVPSVSFDGDTTNFDEYDEKELDLRDEADGGGDDDDSLFSDF